ncbi:TetR/AcrR family transcriptional regulator [Paenibacillus amylolyticus]|uniref:TetR/AcrR family transcriptional regulator n=2 Tax=Paenibacillus TaxID=44249 RepID=UPI00285DC9E4|nr:TetR/AcrR family transcriptional regulator [Paenibacillus sp. 2003]MDR6717243.1 AcrR family transcriptional regulator [Paenibacillus sp. 2003]
MPRTPEQYEAMRLATRTKIQTAAMRLFVRQGYGSTNVQHIADQAGISTGLLYRHYKTKDQLFEELVQFAMAGLETLIARFQTSDEPAEELARFANEVYLDLSSGDDLGHLLLLMSQSFFSTETDGRKAALKQINTDLLQATATLIVQGQRQGQLREGNAFEMAQYFFSSIQGLAMMKVMLEEKFTMPSRSLLTLVFEKEGETL